MRSGRGLGLLVLAVLLLGGALNVVLLRPPPAAPADAPLDRFSAGRAFAHVERIGLTTHVTGSTANAAVRDHLVGALAGLGLQARVQEGVGLNPGRRGEIEMARAQNVVAVLPGTASTGRLLLVAHYDSVETGPGANDDGAGVSTVLETVRALAAGPRPRNAVVVVLTDAEEACLCGAEAFVAHDLLGAGGGVVLNMEARGTGGPPIMFETSAGNAPLARVFGDHAPHPVGTSFAVEVYRTLPNDTDFTVFRDAGGFTGLNTAYIDGSAAYHTPEDTADRLDRRSLQAMGDNTLALARALADADLRALSRPAGGDATYFPVLGGLVRYPGALVWPIAVAALLAVAALALVARRQGTPLRRSAAGFALSLLPLLAAPVAAQGLWALLVRVRPGYAEMVDPWRPTAYRFAVVALVLAVLLAWYAVVRRRVGPAALAIGGLAVLAALGIVLAALAPGGSYLTALPALVGALAGIVGAAARPWLVAALAALAAAVAQVVLVPTIALFFPALGLETGGAPALFTVLLGLAMLPALELLFPPASQHPRRAASVALPTVAAVLAVALVVVGLAVDRFDARHPVPTQLMYALDADARRAWWVSTEGSPVDWTAQYVDGEPAVFPAVADAFPVFTGAVATGPAEPVDLPPPALTTSARDLGDGRRQISVQARSQRPARLLVLSVAAPAAVVAAQVAGRELPGDVLGSNRLTVTFHAPPATGLVASFVVTGDGPVTVRALDGSDGLADVPGFRPRPAHVSLAGSHTSDLLVVGTRRQLG